MSAAAGLASCAVSAAQSRGRLHAEPASREGAFELDRRRILDCMAFRRLTHKTQVFISDVGDHFRTRLTHTLEVASRAERLARAMGLNDCLASAIALAHDLGHSPFGHAGESALAERMADHGGFEHNVQSLRVVDYLEHPYPAFRGLNLSFEVRESLIKHSTRYDRPGRADAAVEGRAELMAAGPKACLEGQVVNLADTIAYTLHDIEDGMGQQVIDEDMLQAGRVWREAAAPVRAAHPRLSLQAIRRPILDRLADILIEDATAHTARQVSEAGVGDVDAVRRHPRELVGFSPQMQTGVEELQALLLRHVYRNHRVVRMDAKARRLVGDLFDAYLAEPALLPERFAARVAQQGAHRVICDYIAGMTDRFCQREHGRLFAPFSFD
jgi:dGTPase